MEKAVSKIEREMVQVWELLQHAAGFKSIQLAAIYAGLSRALTILREDQSNG